MNSLMQKAIDMIDNTLSNKPDELDEDTLIWCRDELEILADEPKTILDNDKLGKVVTIVLGTALLLHLCAKAVEALGVL